MAARNKDVDDVIYSYSSSSNQLEEENKILKETVDHLKDELDKFARVPLMICTVKEIIGKEAIIQIPNGNEFLVGITESCKDLISGDTVLVEQKKLNNN